MPPTKPQGFTEQFYKLVDEQLSQSATKSEVKEVINTFITLLKQLQTTVEQKIGDTGNSLTRESSRLTGSIQEVETRLKGLVDKSVENTTKDFESKLTELSALVGYVADKIEYYDDTEMKNHMQSMDSFMKDMLKKIPKEFDPSEITKDIEELEQKYEALDKKLETIGRNTSGGVSNLRIQQAFKYILKTEEPVGDIDGVNLSYTVSQPIFAVLAFSLNGEVIPQIPNYTISGKTITFSSALPSVYSGKDFEIKYV